MFIAARRSYLVCPTHAELFHRAWRWRSATCLCLLWEWAGSPLSGQAARVRREHRCPIWAKSGP